MSDNPYQTPEHAQPSALSAGSSPYGQVRNLSALAHFSKVMLIINIVLTIAVTIFFMSDYVVTATTTGVETDAELEQFNSILYSIVGLGIVVFILSAIAVCMWTSKAMANAWAHHEIKPTITPGWAAGWYFIPIFMLWKPYVASKQIWHAAFGHRKSDVILLVWWLCWIIATILDRISMKMNEDTTVIDNVSAVLTIIAAVSLIRIINQITDYYNGKSANSY